MAAKKKKTAQRFGKPAKGKAARKAQAGVRARAAAKYGGALAATKKLGRKQRRDLTPDLAGGLFGTG